MSSSGTVSWPPEAPLWTFLWEVADFPDSESIAFRDVFFRGKKVFHKASLPMIRVQYDSGDGPYKDSLAGNNMVGPVKVYDFTQFGFRFVVVESYHVISRYRIVNRWFFRNDGVIQPQLHSAGLQHPSNHRHHVYWRFDFDINGASNNLALEWSSGGPDSGYGPGWRPVTGEEAILNFSGHRMAVLRKGSNLGYILDRGEFDGHADNFSIWDVWVVRYKGEEDLKGRLGNAIEDQLYQHVTGEDIDGQDVVLWYCAHLSHLASHGGDEWHVCGPILRPFGY
jgi:hypothetical protein